MRLLAIRFIPAGYWPGNKDPPPEFEVRRNDSFNTRQIGAFTHLKPTGHVMHHQFNIQQMYALPTLYLCVLYLSENKQRLVPLTA